MLGHGRPVLDAAAAVIMSWRMHRHAGLRLVATASGADVGATVVMCAGWGRVGVLAACRWCGCSTRTTAAVSPTGPCLTIRRSARRPSSSSATPATPSGWASQPSAAPTDSCRCWPDLRADERRT
ncbi:hypothetical protein FRAAL5062 [Frankia alni ACN14a]|uniref:DUF1990 domain-containing protein n=1 Tax=Frankia alni (strain DSM 45986 / CECT 9034 / ACN14a) TaxID=326424 RepID=Q0RFN9_FRAAA|nr:hypothetical protein FRAAL5062 [Frankia alni ACN14a]